MSRLRLEFTVEPFREGGPGPHVLAAVQAVRDAGLSPEDGPFGTAVEAEAELIHALLGPLSVAATAAGATGLRMSVQPAFEIAEGAHELLRTLRPIVHALGGSFIDANRLRSTDVPLDWNGQRIGGVRPAASSGSHLSAALEVAIAEVEALVGGRLGALSRSDKQRAASLLSERGVFHLRNAVDEVADAMNVSRATIYNYLAAAKREV
jgi:uncharacterized protein YqgV (UPF0045/DUF77 family)